MTKLFNSVEEMNEFLKDGRTVSKIEFAGGMISVHLADTTDCKSKETTTKSLEEYVTEIIKTFHIGRSYTGEYYCSEDILKSIAAYASSFPKGVGESVIRYFITNSSFHIYSRDAELLVNKANGL